MPSYPFHLSQGSFLSGILAPDAQGRSDATAYAHGAAELLNVIVRRPGTAASRPGFSFVASLPGPARLAAVHRDGVPYIIALLDAQVRIYNGQTGDLVVTFNRNMSDSWINLEGPEVYIPWTVDDLRELSIAAIGNTLIIAHYKYQPCMIGPGQGSGWKISRYVLADTVQVPEVHPLGDMGHKHGTLRVVSVDTTSTTWSLVLEPLAVTVQPPLSGAPPIYDNEQNCLYAYKFYKGFVGTLSLPIAIYWRAGGEGTLKKFHGTVESVTDHTYDGAGGYWRRWNRITVVFRKSIAGNKPDSLVEDERIGQWEEMVFGPFRLSLSIYNPNPHETPLYQWPAAIAVIEGRLWMAGRSAAGLIYASSTRSIYDWNLSAGGPADAIGLRVLSEGLVDIRHICAGDRVLVAARNGVLVLDADSGEPLAPDTVRPRRVATFGTALAQPLFVDGAFLIAEPDSGVVRAARRDRDTLALKVDDVSIAISGKAPRFVSSCLLPGQAQREDTLALWLGDDGTIWSLYLNASLEVASWTKWETAGGSFYDIVNAMSDLWCVIARDGNYSLERMVPDRWFDSSKILDTPSTPAPHLANRVVHVRRGNAWVGTETLASNGVLSAAMQARLEEQPEGPLEVGLEFPWRIKMLSPGAHLPNGTMRARPMRCRSVRVFASNARVLRIDGEPAAVEDPVPLSQLQTEPYWARVMLLGTVECGTSDKLQTVISRERPMPVAVHGVVRVLAIRER